MLQKSCSPHERQIKLDDMTAPKHLKGANKVYETVFLRDGFSRFPVRIAAIWSQWEKIEENMATCCSTQFRRLDWARTNPLKDGWKTAEGGFFFCSFYTSFFARIAFFGLFLVNKNTLSRCVWWSCIASHLLLIFILRVEFWRFLRPSMLFT